MFSGAAAAAAAGATGGSGLWLFSYNKENYGYDAGMRFGRFMTARGMANAQVGQYREDIQGIVGATVSKMDAWQTVTTLFLAVGAALSCAGRVGMHGCAPPGWFCALFSGSIFMSVMFNGVSLWLAMHASLRAQCASVSLLTRKVRLPIPSMGQIDQARVFGSGFEKQEWRDIFRVPFMRHPNAAPDMPVPETQAGKKSKGQAHDPQKEFASTARDTVPSWIRDEAVVDKGEGFMGAGDQDMHEPREAPAHFQMLMQAQEEWRDYDVYARITMLYGVVSFLYAVTYYAVGTAISELRGFWVMWTLPLVFMTAQALIMRLDILQEGQHRLPKAELVGHAAPFFACAACTLEYRYFYSEASVVAAWGLALLAIFCHFVMALRMLDLAWPADKPVEDMPEEAGRQWWPGSWRVPRAFTKHLWFITPPKELDEKVAPCLLHEMEDMAANGGGVSEGRRRRAPKAAKASFDQNDPALKGSPLSCDFGLKRPADLPWQLVRIVILTAAVQWFFIMITTSAEVILGPESLLKPPGEPPWIRDTKYRTWGPEKVHLSNMGALPDKYRLFYASQAHYTGTDVPVQGDVHVGLEDGVHGAAEPATSAEPAAHHRRLQQKNGTERALDELLKLMPQLGHLADQVLLASADRAPAAAPALAPAAGSFMAAAAKVRDVAWPTLFEPQHLACGAAGAAALTPHGVGAWLPAGPEDEAVQAKPFALEGLGLRGRIAGAALTSEGLRVVTSTGKILRCAVRDHDVWQCESEASIPALPLAGGMELLAAAAPGDATSSSPRVAVVYKHMPQVATILELVSGSWHAAGEVHLPPGAGPRPSLSFGPAGDLTISTASGEVHQRGPSGSSVLPAPAVDRAAREFRAACSAPAGESLWHLTLTQAEAGGAWRPELLLSQ